MEERDLKLAADFCKLVQSSDLLAYLGVSQDSSAKALTEALSDRRRRLQGMQSNPKYRASAMFLLKNYQALARVVKQPQAHLEYLRRERESGLIPMLELAIDSVLVDGVITPQEERFIHRAAASLGIAEETYNRVVRERAAKAGVHLPDAPTPGGPPFWAGGKTLDVPARGAKKGKPSEVSGAADHNWWDAGFTHLLLKSFPGGPGEMVDVYCRTAPAALTLLPQRQQLTYLGVDHNASRLEQARAALAPFGDRAKLVQGKPDEVPIPNGSVDYVLAIRALAYQADTRPVFAEGARVLRPGGRMVVAEPDELAETFYFEGHLREYNAAFHRLGKRIDEAMAAEAPSGGEPGIALGPKLAERLEGAGLEVVDTAVHAASALKPRAFGRLSKLLSRYPLALARAAGLSKDTEELRAIGAAVKKLKSDIPEDRVGLCGRVMPMFLSVGVKP
jgi:SAM-dependent methyltransferase